MFDFENHQRFNRKYFNRMNELFEANERNYYKSIGITTP